MSDQTKIPMRVTEVKHNVQIAYKDASKGSYSGTEIHGTVLGSNKPTVERITSKTLGFKKELAARIKGLKAGDAVVLVKEKINGFNNLVGIEEATARSSTVNSVVTQHATTDTYSQRAARGQALNLAVAVAVAAGKHMDDKFILNQVDRFLTLGEVVQEGKSVATASVVEDDEVEDLI